MMSKEVIKKKKQYRKSFNVSRPQNSIENFKELQKIGKSSSKTYTIKINSKLSLFSEQEN